MLLKKMILLTILCGQMLYATEVATLFTCRTFGADSGVIVAIKQTVGHAVEHILFANIDVYSSFEKHQFVIPVRIANIEATHFAELAETGTFDLQLSNRLTSEQKKAKAELLFKGHSHNLDCELKTK